MWTTMMLMLMKTLVEAPPISGPALMWIPQWLSLLIVEPTVFVTPGIVIIIVVIIIVVVVIIIIITRPWPAFGWRA